MYDKHGLLLNANDSVNKVQCRHHIVDITLLTTAVHV